MERQRGPVASSEANNTADSHSINYLTFPFGISERPDGGLPTVIMNEAKNSGGRRVGMFTTDRPNVTEFDGVKIFPAQNPPMIADLFKLWFGTGYWPLLHSKAHTRDAITPDALKAMYPKPLVEKIAEDAERAGRRPSTDVGSHELLHEFVRKYAPSQEVSRAFNRSFEQPFIDELSRAHVNRENVRVNFQDYFFHPLVEKMAPLIRKQHGFTSLHLHTTIPMMPEHLPIPESIEDLARAVSQVDVVLTHTEVYNERLRRIMERLGFRLPEFRTFDLGIDEDDMRRREGRITMANYQSAIPDFDNLTDRQQKLVHACFQAERHGVPHQFGLYDRMDPGKGIDAVFLAVDAFLTEERKFLSMEELQAKYRFFNLMSMLSDLKDVDPTNMKATYAEYVTRLGLELEQKWPGIFLMAEGVSGKQRDLLVALMRGRTVITGGAEDGLNQVVMESSFINRDLPTAVIAGRNIGFVMQMEAAGMGHDLFAFDSGNVEQLTATLRDVVRYQTINPDYLVRQKRDLNRIIEARNSSMLLDF